MENLISVVIVTYNQEDTIRRSIDSVLMQECHVPFEIVIGEDCSTDGTRAICEAYAQKYPDIIRLFCNEHNKGINDNYFDCLLQCRGRYIADCAGDDFWTDPKKLEKEVCVMEAHPEVTMVITNWQFYDELTRTTYPSHQRLHAPITAGNKLLKDIITQRNMSLFHLCTSLYKAEVFRKAYEEDAGLFRQPNYVSEDMQIAFVMAQHGDIAYLPDVTLHYSIGNESVSAQKDEARQFRFLRNVTQLSFDLAKRYGLKSPTMEAFFSLRIFTLGMHAFRAHDAALFQETLDCEQEWQPQRTAKIQLLFFVMRHEALWRIALLMRQVFVGLKQARR
jgi:glycosyltransferase involved in cell wall biosynthesis